MRSLKSIYGLMMFLLCSCSHIDESERFLSVDMAQVVRSVLIEDFTGQRCLNCPNGASTIARLQEQYGEDHVIAVGIHSGPLAVFPRDGFIGLRTTLGDIYYDYWAVEEEPSALINRRGGVVTLNQWQSRVHEELQLQSAISFEVNSQLLEDGAVDVNVTAVSSAAYNGKLQLWLTESEIVAPQMMPDGTVRNDYVHQHVLRAAVNGDWGEDVAWRPGETKSYHYVIKPSADWNVRQLAVVVFAYSPSGVDQAAVSHVNH